VRCSEPEEAIAATSGRSGTIGRGATCEPSRTGRFRL
jgi:hypothetical protein